MITKDVIANEQAQKDLSDTKIDYKKLSLIAAMASNRVIGKQNKMPWHLSADLAHFKSLTMGKAIIMGRKTFESIGKPLVGRQNIVLSRDATFQAKGCTVTHSVEQALNSANNREEIMVIGGAELYQLFLPQADCIYLTVIDSDFDGDTYFPALNSEEWREIKRLDFPSEADLPYPYSFITLEKILS